MKNKQHTFVYCNCCGKPITTASQLYKDYLQVEKTWRYFSTKDSMTHKFNICETCYDRFTSNFVIPVSSSTDSGTGGYNDKTLEQLSTAYKKLNIG